MHWVRLQGKKWISRQRAALRVKAILEAFCVRGRTGEDDGRGRGDELTEVGRAYLERSARGWCRSGDLSDIESDLVLSIVNSNARGGPCAYQLRKDRLRREQCGRSVIWWHEIELIGPDAFEMIEDKTHASAVAKVAADVGA